MRPMGIIRKCSGVLSCAVFTLLFSQAHAAQPLSLEDAKSAALAINPLVNSAEARIQAAKSYVNQILSTYHPKVTANGQLNAEKLSSMRANDASARYRTYLQADWVLYDGGQRRHETKASLKAVDAKVNQKSNSERLLAQATSNAYFNVLAAERNVETYKAVLVSARKFADDSKNAAAATGEEFRATDAIKVISSAERALNDARTDAQTARMALAELMGQPLSKDLMLRPLSLPKVACVSPANAYGSALSNRPDLLAAKDRVAETTELIGARRAQGKPRLGFVGQVGAEGDGSPRKGDGFAFAGVGLTIPLWDGGKVKSEVCQAKAVSAEAIADKDAAVNTVMSEVRIGLARIDGVKNGVALEKKSVSLAQTRVAELEAKVGAGALPAMEVLEAQIALDEQSGAASLGLIEQARAEENLRAVTAGNVSRARAPASQSRR